MSHLLPHLLPHRVAADRLIELAEGEETRVLPVFCITEFLRVVTHMRAFNPPSSTTEALDFIKGLLEAPGCTVAYLESEFLSRLESVVREADARGNLIFDAEIAALCREQGIGTIVTNDRDFARFRPLQVSYLSAGT